jgi:hypothetical protein
MKWFVLVLVGALFIALAGCDGSVADISPQQATQFVQMLTITAYTPTPINTPNPSEKFIVEILNDNLKFKVVDSLALTVESSFKVEKAAFLAEWGTEPVYFSVEIHCECINNDSCCNVRHSFVVLVEAMKASPEIFTGFSQNNIQTIPPTIRELRVEIYDHETWIGMTSVPWPHMRNYLMGAIDGYQLGGIVNKIPTPTP